MAPPRKETRESHAAAGARAALCLGGNLGDRVAYLAKARAHLEGWAGLRVEAASSVYETQPVECGPQPWYLNQVLVVGAPCTPHGLLALCNGVERALGRRRGRRHASRTLDVDLLFYGEWVMKTPRLFLPHPALARRRSMLVPLAEVYPSWRHPLLGRTASGLLEICSDYSVVRRLR